jgi:hypothetical protein
LVFDLGLATHLHLCCVQVAGVIRIEAFPVGRVPNALKTLVGLRFCEDLRCESAPCMLTVEKILRYLVVQAGPKTLEQLFRIGTG